MSPRPDSRPLLGGLLQRVRDYGLTIGVIVVAIASWYVYSAFINTRGNIYFPSIEYTIRQTVIHRVEIVSGLILTFQEVVIGFFLAVFLGIVLGALFGESLVVRRSFLPIVIYILAVPGALVAPLFLVLIRGVFGVALFVAYSSFFTLFLNTMTGFSQVDEEFYHLGDVMGATRWQMMKKIKFWSALPHITSGVKVAIQQSIVGAIVAEFIATGGGIGQRIILAMQTINQGMMFGTLIVIIVFAVVMYVSVSRALDRLTPGPTT